MTKTDRIRQVLMELLPSQHVIDTICEDSACWMLISAFHKMSGDESNPADSSSTMSSAFNLTELWKLHPTAIAKSLLYIAVCLQQLPFGFDESKLQMGSVEARIDKILSTVQSLVIADDELVSTFEGLECLIIQGIFHINGGNPRRAWLTFRRALNVGQLMGIHKAGGTRVGEQMMWGHIVQADRYLVCSSRFQLYSPIYTDLHTSGITTRSTGW